MRDIIQGNGFRSLYTKFSSRLEALIAVKLWVSKMLLSNAWLTKDYSLEATCVCAGIYVLYLLG